MIDWSLFPNFSAKEFACKCCGESNMDEAFICFLQDARADIGRPFTVTSGYRCKDYEKQVGGSGKNHPYGKAVDIVADRSTMSKLAARGEAYGFTGIGVSLHGKVKFIHLDTTHNDITVWSY
jgi:zinc D-Ala-D-Ala carboxypeptidase